LERPEEAVKWLLAAQAQDFVGAKWSLGARLGTATDADVQQAFDQGAILRTHVLRPTWHFVTPDDIGWLLELTAPRVRAKNAGFYRTLGLDATQLMRANETLAEALRGGRSLTRDELREVLHQGGFHPDRELRFPYFLMNAELDGVICSGPRRGKSFTYALLEERAPRARRLGRGDALAEMARRYFRSRGPATVQDLAKWSGLTVADARTGLEAVNDEFEQQSLDGQTFWYPPSDPPTARAGPEAHLLSIYDEYISGYKDRSAILQPGYWDRLMGLGNALTHIIILQGQLVGSWKRSLGKSLVTVRLNPFRELTGDERRLVVEAAERFAAFVGLPLEWATE
jgi:hypothetical protein